MPMALGLGLGMGRGLGEGKSSLLSSRVGLWKASVYSGSGSLPDLSGNGNHAQFGSSASADSNDPTWLRYTGQRACYFPGVSGNYASAPDAAPVKVTGDLGLRALFDPSTWTPGVNFSLIGKYNAVTSQKQYCLALASSTGLPTLFYSENGTSTRIGTATAAMTIPASGPVWLDVRRNPTTGEVFFYQSLDGLAWTQIGGDAGEGRITPLFDGTAIVEIGSQAAGAQALLTGTVYRAQIFNSLSLTATPVFDCDFTDPAAWKEPFTSLVEKSANGATVTVNRSTSGKKATALDRSRILAGTDDFLEAADANSLDFAANESLTVTKRFRVHGTPSGNQVLIAKKANLTTGAGWALYLDTSRRPVGIIADGTNSTTVTGTALTQGVEASVSFVRDVANDRIYLVQDGVPRTPVTDTTTGSLVNSEVLRMGRLSGAGTNYGDFSAIGWALHRRVLSDAECTLQALELV